MCYIFVQSDIYSIQLINVCKSYQHCHWLQVTICYGCLGG